MKMLIKNDNKILSKTNYLCGIFVINTRHYQLKATSTAIHKNKVKYFLILSRIIINKLPKDTLRENTRNVKLLI